MQPVDLPSTAWIAGLFEGEGTISVRPGRVSVVLAMTDRDVIARLHALTGLGTFSESQPRNVKWKRVYWWRVTYGPDVADFLRLVRPWLGERRAARADEALEEQSRQQPYTRQGATSRECPEHGSMRRVVTNGQPRGWQCPGCKADRQRQRRRTSG
jgi:hypothetical protein